MKIKNLVGILMLIGLVVISGCFSFPGRVKDPVFTPAPGSFQTSVTVTLTSATTGAQIRYTTDGSTPTETSALYSSPLTFTQNTNLKAQAFKDTLLPSNVVSGTYTVTTPTPTAVAPTFSPNGGSHVGSVRVTMASSTSGAQIRYTTNGAEPTTSSTLYSSPINLTTTTTLKAKTFATGYNPSTTTTATYTITTPPSSGTVVRSLSSSTVARNGQITVTLTRNIPTTYKAYLLEETINGMTLSNVQVGCGTITNNVLKVGRIDEGGFPPVYNEICTYTLTAPNTPGTYTFSGKYVIDDGGEMIVGGSTTVTVN